MNVTDLRQLRRLGSGLFTAALIVLHARLLWSRWSDGSLFEPGVIARWLASAVLLTAMLALYRRHSSLFSGRRSAVLWLLVALLHAAAGITPVAATEATLPWLAAPTLALALAAGAAALRPREPQRLVPVAFARTCSPGLPPAASRRPAGARAPPLV